MTLDIQNLSFERDNEFLFEKISRRLNDGDCLQVTGANGCGKSTLLRLLAGFIPAAAQTIFWNGQCIAKQGADFQRQLHYLGHHSGYRAHLTVRENLIFNIALSGGEHNAIESVCEKIGLRKQLDKLAADLSAGQRQRLALTRLLMVRQPLWILDEPMTALDQAGREYLQFFLSQHLEAGGIAVIATHHDFLTQAKTLTLGDQHV